MSVEAILDQAEELGIILRVDGDLIRYRPKSAAPPEFVRALRQHKAELLTLLRPRVLSAYPQWHAKEVARRVVEEGVCLFWSDLFREVIAFIVDDSYRDQIPKGVVVYALSEIRLLFPDGEASTKSCSLRLIHEAKKKADARVIDVAWNDQEEPESEALEF